jgi:hypothetical protein
VTRRARTVFAVCLKPKREARLEPRSLRKKAIETIGVVLEIIHRFEAVCWSSPACLLTIIPSS